MCKHLLYGHKHLGQLSKYNHTFTLGISLAVEGKTPAPAEPQHSYCPPLRIEARAQSIHLPNRSESNILPCIAIARTDSRHYVLWRYKQKYKPVQSEEERTPSAYVHCTSLGKITLNTYSAGEQCSCETTLLYKPQKPSKGVWMVTPSPKKPTRWSIFNIIQGEIKRRK